MPKAYWIAQVTVTDPERYVGYQAVAPEAFQAHGARFLARGGRTETVEGPEWARHVVIEFDSLDQALACYQSDAYTIARSKRDGACEAQIFITEGLG